MSSLLHVIAAPGSTRDKIKEKKKNAALSGGHGLLATWSAVCHDAVDDSARLVHADSESELGCCKVLGANGGSETITDAGDYCIRGVCALRV